MLFDLIGFQQCPRETSAKRNLMQPAQWQRNGKANDDQIRYFFRVLKSSTALCINGLRGWWARQDLNLRPSDYESPALTPELRAQIP